MADLTYLSGLNNEHATEAVPDVLPIGQNSPQQPVRRIRILQTGSSEVLVVDLRDQRLRVRAEELLAAAPRRLQLVLRTGAQKPEVLGLHALPLCPARLPASGRYFER